MVDVAEGGGNVIESPAEVLGYCSLYNQVHKFPWKWNMGQLDMHDQVKLFLLKEPELQRDGERPDWDCMRKFNLPLTSP